MPLGKLPPEIMHRFLLGMKGARSRSLEVPPSIGLDFGVIALGDRTHLIVSSDPVTGVTERAGWYAVNVSANDVATSGNRPRFMQSIILLPQGAGINEVRRVSRDMDETAKHLGVTIVGGHTEVTPGLDRTIVGTTMMSVARSFVTAAGGRPGDLIMMTKSAGIEGTAILGADERFAVGGLGGRARRYYEKLSVVDEAVAAFGTGRVHAMHDCTEGGVLGALYEMSVASGTGFEVEAGRIPVSKETADVCSALGAEPLKLISSGTLLIAVEEGAEELVRRAVRAGGSTAGVIGRFTGSGTRRVMIGEKGEPIEVKTAPVDEIWRLQSTLTRPRSPAEMTSA